MAIRTVTLCRECTHCDGNGEIEFDVDVDGEYEKAEPDVGIMTGEFVIHSAMYAGTKNDIELTDEEKQTIIEEAAEDYEEDNDDRDDDE